MKLRSSLRLLRRVRWTHISNAALVLGSYYLSRITGRSWHAGLPLSMSIEPTTACNLRCPECPSGLRSFTRPTGKIDLSMLEQLLPSIRGHCLFVNFYFQGEPYLHPGFFDMVRLSRQHGIFTSTSTNAHFLDDDRARATVESGLDRLIISIDGTTQETYQAYRKEGSLEKVVEGTKNVLKWRKKMGSNSPEVVFQFLVVRPNEHQVEEVKALAKSLGVDDVWLKTAQIYDFEHGSDLIPLNDRYSRYRQQSNGLWTIKNPLDNHCWRMWSGCVITWDGRVVPCCFDKDAQHAMGNVNQHSLKEIWKGKDYKNFRAAILRSRSEIEMCRNCSEGTEVFG